jgi:hypothetical protein
MSDDERISVGTQLRHALKVQLDAEVKRLGGAKGMRQTILEAALFNYLSQPEASRDTLVERVLSSNMIGGARSLVQEAEVKAKRAAGPKASNTRDPK